MSVVLNLLNPLTGSHIHNIYLILCIVIFFCCIAYINIRRDRRRNDSGETQRVFAVGSVRRREDNDVCSPPFLPFKEHVPYRPDEFSDREMVERSKGFYEMMKRRRAVRSYRRDRVPIEAITNAVKAAGTGPSGVHTQPWTYIVVVDPKMKMNIRKIVQEEEKLNYERRMSKQWVTDLKPLGTNWEKPYLTDASALLLIFRQFYSTRDNGNFKAHYFCELSVGIAAGILAAGLQTAGLASIPTAPLNCGPRLRSLLSRPENEKLTLLFAIGKAAHDCKVPDLDRKSVDEFYLKI